MDAMTPQVRKLYDAWEDLSATHSQWQTDLQGFTMPPLTRWLALASDHMRQLTPLVAGTGKALDNLAQSADRGLTGPYWLSFIDFAGRQAEPTLTSLGRTFGWLTLGVTGLAVSFEPLWDVMSTGLENSSRSFADWANNADNFTGFISWTIENGPVLLGVLGDLFGAIIDVGVAIAPLGMVYAQGIGLLAQGLSWLAETSPGLLQLAVAAITARMAIQLLSRVNQGLIVPLREGATRIGEYAGSLRQVDGAATSAAAGTRGFSGALGGAMGVLGGPWGIALLAATTAEVLAGMKDQLPGSVKFIFQPAEESPADFEPDGKKIWGAKMMVQEGVLDNPKVDAIFGLHVSSSYPVGKLSWRSGPAMAKIAIDASRTNPAQSSVSSAMIHGPPPAITRSTTGPLRRDSTNTPPGVSGGPGV